MLHRMVVLAGLFYALCAWAVDPSTNLQTYYAAADGKATDANDALRKQLCTIICTGYTTIGYSSLPNSVYAASSNPSDFYVGSSMTMEDIYSSKAYVVGDAGSSASTCGTGWNKEHTVPQSWFREESPMKSDAHHIFPTDIHMNSTRSNYPYGENSASKTCDQYGYGHLGNSNLPGYSGKVFDPGTEEECGGKSYRGDLARVYFYMATRYRTIDFTSGTGGTSFTYVDGVADLTDYMRDLMLKWHREDPVSEKELIRNNAIYAHQKNRNPFVDYPCLVEYIWGEHKGEAIDLSALVSGYAGVGTDCCSGSGGGGGEGGGSVDPTPTPEEYYAPVEGLQDSVLKSRLAILTWDNFTKRYSYGSGSNHTWEAFWYTDRDESDNRVIDRYSNNKRYFDPDNKTASVTDCHIEHMFPNSWFGGESGNQHAYCDLHHLMPADGSANSSKGNRGPGVPTDTTFNNGVWVNGKDGLRGNLTVFCPPDRYKGDFARAYFYIATTYGDTAVWQTDNAASHMTNDDWHEFLPATRELLLQWHREDPVSEEERIRHNTVYGLQGNRNPFIDYPCLAEYIWGTMQGEVFELNCSATPTPKYTITWSIKGETRSDEIKQGAKPTPPSVDNCSATRVFMGWTTSSKVTSKPAVLYAANEIPAATAAATYYAVFADKKTTESGTPSTTSFVFPNKGYTNGQAVTSAEQDDVTISFAKGSNSSNAPRYYDDGTSIRCYGGNTITVTAGGITKIVFTFGAKESTNTISVAPGTYNAGTKTWTGSSDNVVFTIDGTSGNRRIQQMDVTAGSGSYTSYSNYGLECETCTPTAPEFEIGEATMSLNKGDQREIWYIYEPYDTPGTITYESDHPKIASVDEYGLVTALSAGTARITVHLSATECEKAADFYCDVTVHDFHTLEATNVTSTSFTANWTSDKTDCYNLDVYYSKIIESSELKNDTLYLKDFSTDIDGWTINTISGYENVWTYSSSYNCLYGTSYVNKTRYAAESRIVSPAIDLTQTLSAELSLFHAFKYSTTIALQVSTDDGASWTNVSASPWTTFSSWDFAYATADLSDYIGQTIRVAFYYEGLSTACPTWEIQKLCISGLVNHTTYTPQTVHVDSYPKQVTGTSQNITGLERATTYYYTVQPKDGELSDPVEVTTTDSGCKATITIQSYDESMGTVEFVE